MEKKPIKLDGYEENLGYKDDEIITIENEFEQIQHHIGMYISYGGVKGALHLFKEIFNNSLDECINDGSPGNKISLYHTEKSNQIICVDNGRGIPFNKMVEVCTKKHSGSKDGRAFNKYSAGENGVGIKVTVALSKFFSMECYRGKFSRKIEFIDSMLTEHEPEPLKKERTGTKIVFQPSEQWLGECHISSDAVLKWLNDISYIIPEGITIEYTLVNDEDKEIFRTYSYRPIENTVKKMAPNAEFDPISISVENDHMELQVAFTYDSNRDDMVVESFCNYVNTVDGGYHEEAACRAIYEFFVAAAKEMDPNAKNEVTIEDCRKGLMMFVNCRHEDPKLGGQTKEKVDNKEISTEGKPMIKKALTDFFANNNTLLKKIVGYLRQMAKIRLDAHKSKSAYVKKAKSWMDEASIVTYLPLTNRNHKGYCELLICEGKSAKGNMSKARNPMYQAVIALKGVAKNIVDCNSFDEATVSETLRTLATVLDCGVGKNFNINDLKWNKIIIMTDADCDGSFIMSLILCFFVMYFPEVIREGRIYRCLPPLYDLDLSSIKSKKIKKRFLFDKMEYYSVCHQIIAENVELELIEDDYRTGNMVKSTPLSQKEIVKFLDANRNYYTKLGHLVTHTRSSMKLLELVCRFYPICGGVDERFAKFMKKYLPEMDVSVKNRSIYGSIEKSHDALIIDDLFLGNAAEMIKLVRDNEPYFYVAFRNKNSKNHDKQIVTIGEFIDKVNASFNPDINKRYKGLGEMQTDVMFESSFNPHIRKLIRLTANNMDKVVDTMMLLHSGSSSDGRKELIRKATFTIDDIDN